jgi:hypothetical protein
MEFSKYFEKLPFFGVLTRWAVQVRALSTEEKVADFYTREHQKNRPLFSLVERRGAFGQ